MNDNVLQIFPEKEDKKLPLSHVITWVSVEDSLPEFNVQEEGEMQRTTPILCLHSDGHMESCFLCEDEDGMSPYWVYESDAEWCETVTHYAKESLD